MKTLENQLLDYGELHEEVFGPIRLDEVTSRPATPTASGHWWWRRHPMALATATMVVVVLGFIVFQTLPWDPAPVANLQSPFRGSWLSSDGDKSTQRMTVRVSGDGTVEIVVLDDAASVCSGAPSTMTGTGRLQSDTVLAVPVPVFTCDDGSEPEVLSGPPLEDMLQNLTFTHEPDDDTLTDSLGLVWSREGAEDLSPEPTVTISDTMWPQSSLEEVQEAQELADAGDPNYTWQFGLQLTLDDPWAHVDELELVDRFLREVLGWEAYLFDFQSGDGDGWVDGLLTDQRFLRCAPGRTNPLYPPGPEPERGEGCAPTLDDFRYESVSLDLAQPVSQGPTGIWVVNRWSLTAPFAQADPAVVEVEATEGLEEFLTARIAGQGAEGHVKAYASPHSFGVDHGLDVPLLYATSSGAPYERYEIELVGGPHWPDGFMEFVVRLFADGGASVVEQEISWEPCCGGLWLLVSATTENGQPVTLSYTSSDGEVSVAAPGSWSTYSGGGTTNPYAPDVWFWELYRGEIGDEDRIDFTDPVAYDAWCAAQGGSPLLTAPASAAEIAQELIADPNFDTTAPVTTRVGGLEAVSVDVAMAPGGRGCGIGVTDITRWIHTIGWGPGWRLRLYLVDLPEGMSVPTLAITVVAPEERFDEVIAETAPIIESIEFHTP